MRINDISRFSIESFINDRDRFRMRNADPWGDPTALFFELFFYFGDDEQVTSSTLGNMGNLLSLANQRDLQQNDTNARNNAVEQQALNDPEYITYCTEVNELVAERQRNFLQMHELTLSTPISEVSQEDLEKFKSYFKQGEQDKQTKLQQMRAKWNALIPQIDASSHRVTNTAYDYLLTNNEMKRAEMLRSFVVGLSNLTVEYPWTFVKITNFEDALKRVARRTKIEEERPSIVIECQPEGYDRRVSTLFDLYRASVWSHTLKREVVPSNLRRFDMGLYIYSIPVASLHLPAMIRDKVFGNNTTNAYKYTTNDDTTHALYNVDFENVSRQATSSSYASYGIKTSSSQAMTSKYYEFHNCEFDYDSLCEMYSNTLDNGVGVVTTPKLKITFDDVYETSYNEFLDVVYGDIVEWDIKHSDDMKSYDIAHGASRHTRAEVSKDANGNGDSSSSQRENNSTRRSMLKKIASNTTSFISDTLGNMFAKFGIIRHDNVYRSDALTDVVMPYLTRDVVDDVNKMNVYKDDLNTNANRSNQTLHTLGSRAASSILNGIL